MTLVVVPCAVCSSTDFAPVYDAALQDLDDPARHFSSSRAAACHMPIVRCRDCGLVQSNPRDDAETLAGVYAALADQVYDSEDRNRDIDAAAHLKLVLSHRKPPGRLLDIGCATGIFVGRAHAAGFDATGTDASTWAIERARVRFPTLRFVEGMLESMSFEPHSFDVITLWDVLEHVDSPRQVLGRVAEWLKPDGVVCMSMPNANSVMARAMGRRWVLLLREHLWYFSPETMERLLAQAGFVLIQNRSKWVTFSVANVALRFSQYGGPLAGIAGRLGRSSLLRAAPVRFPMGEMDVVARAR